MTNFLSKVWDAYVAPMVSRPKRLQVAALCYRGAGNDKQVLLITSRDTGRWIIPKGWPIRGLNAPEAALQEAWEEAGVTDSEAEDSPIGAYRYHKRQDSGLPVPVETLVFPVEVEALKDAFPEASERTRRWVSPEEAANLVNEPELKTILREF